MSKLERLLWVIALVVTIPLALLWFTVPMFFGVFVGLPIAAVKFVLTGRSGIEWYGDTVMDFVIMKWPLWLWEDSMKRRAAPPPASLRAEEEEK